MPASEAKKTRISRKSNFWLALLWLAMVAVAKVFGWYYSVAFIAGCSIYANFASHVAAWRSDANPNSEQLDRIEALLRELLSKT